ncbi:aminotransferase [Actibacterium sp. 188UL27-1]|uniref:aminotransferase n=1 Tax=Actibacterium sp. 188UL27-1 TaxID=2786961 RepID=UPI00195B5CD9|nr:aminotransferase [Actibacterium sp. 188UL27-1]MBM7067642.1 aminotransferase [Actibacterium sp. 188UL27-1]
MTLPVSPQMSATFPPPVMEARRWLEGRTFASNRPLLNVSQAAPVDPPPEELRQAMAQIILSEPESHLYGPVLGLPELREELARTWSHDYRGSVGADQVAITSGCNQAFAAALATLAGPGDEVILPTPWYFNHKMWLDMAGVAAIALPCGSDMQPDPARAATLITTKTRAIALVTPNNPTGAEYDPQTVQTFFELARSHGIALIVDETYRDFHAAEPGTALHPLFQNPDWDKTLICLYSFSKAYRLTGHRVGAMIAGAAQLSQVEKFLDTVAICPNQLGQRAALWGMQNLGSWLAGERLEILDRRGAIQDHFTPLKQAGWQLLGCGAYFAYIRHPFAVPSNALAPRLVDAAQILCLPGTMFMPTEDPGGADQLRIAFANIDRSEIAVLMARLAEVTNDSLADATALS